MKVLILNSGMGTRMGKDSSEKQHKCMTSLTGEESIVSRQLRMIEEVGLRDVIMTTGSNEEKLVEYCNSLNSKINLRFVKNERYSETNYIYSIFCAREYLDDDIILMHGDLVFEKDVLCDVVNNNTSCMVVSTAVELPDKDFKAVINDGKIVKVGIEFFHNAIAAQPLYKLYRDDWRKWLNKITQFCENNNVKCYAENALNEIAEGCGIYPYDVGTRLCQEVDTKDDLEKVINKLEKYR